MGPQPLIFVHKKSLFIGVLRGKSQPNKEPASKEILCQKLLKRGVLRTLAGMRSKKRVLGGGPKKEAEL